MGKDPLAAPLAHVLLDIDRVFDRLAGHPLVLWADLLRVVPDEGIGLGELPVVSRVSRRALKMWLVLEKLGWLEVSADKVVRLTEKGRRARGRGAELVVEAEDRWSAQVGPAVEPLRAALASLVGQVAVELPHHPIPYGIDPSAVGGVAVAAKPGPPRIPAHGTDWVPVVRTDPVDDLPLHALVSQALMAFTIDYEEQARLAMTQVAVLHEVMPDGELPLAAMPPVLGVKGNSKTLLERHGVVRVSGSGRSKIAHLTPTGLLLRDRHQASLAGVADLWRHRYGEGVVDDLADRLEAVDARLDAELPDYVLVRFVPGVGFL